MTPERIQTVQSTWAKVLPIKDAAARLFCERLVLCESRLAPRGSPALYERRNSTKGMRHDCR